MAMNEQHHLRCRAILRCPISVRVGNSQRRLQHLLMMLVVMSACQPGGNGHGIGVLRSEETESYRSERFFSEDSSWNTPIERGAQFMQVPGLETWPVGFSSWLGDVAASVPVYFAADGDPDRPILFNRDAWNNVESGAWRRTGNPQAVEREILETAEPMFPYPGNYYSTQVAGLTWNTLPSGLPPTNDYANTTGLFDDGPIFARIPPSAVPSPDGDGHMVVIQPDGRALELYATIVLSTGEVVSSMFSFTDPAGTGSGREHGRRASMLPSYGGILRSAEIADGEIDHAMVLLAPPAMLSTSFVEPALAFDSDPSDYGGTLPMGARLAIPPEVDIDDLGLRTSFGAMIAAAAKTYGFYIGDRGGPGWTIVTEYRPSSQSLAEWDRDRNEDLNRIFEALRQVVL
jgi:hypothetical protein